MREKQEVSIAEEDRLTSDFQNTLSAPFLYESMSDTFVVSGILAVRATHEDFDL